MEVKKVRYKRLKGIWNKIKQDNPKREQMELLEDLFKRFVEYYRNKVLLKERVIKQQYGVLDTYRQKLLNLERENDRLRASRNDLHILMMLCAEYGYTYHTVTSFPDKDFESNCMNNFLQYLIGTHDFTLEQVEAIKSQYLKYKE